MARSENETVDKVDMLRRIIGGIDGPSSSHRNAYSHSRDASKLVLESVTTGLCSTPGDISSLLSRLLFPPDKTEQEYLCQLELHKLVTIARIDPTREELNAEDSACLPRRVCVSSTQLGRAALASSLPPEAALFVYTDLLHASRSVALDTELHMLYLVTPINYTVWSGVDWHLLYTVHSRLAPQERGVANLVGVEEGFLVRRLQGSAVHPSEQRAYQVHLRFFSSLALFDVVNEKPLAEVAAAYGINRGALQTLQYQSATYAGMVVAFCSRLGWSYLHALLDGFASRLSFGVRAELTELVRVEGVDGARARAFHDAGISSMADLAHASVRDISRVLSTVVPFDGKADNDGRGEWLFGEPRLPLHNAAETLRERAALALRLSLAAFGISVDLVRFASRAEKEEKKFGENKKETKNETCAIYSSRQHSLESSRGEEKTVHREDTHGILKEIVVEEGDTDEATVGRDEATVGRDEATVGRDEATVGRDEATVGRDEATVGRDEDIPSKGELDTDCSSELFSEGVENDEEVEDLERSLRRSFHISNKENNSSLDTRDWNDDKHYTPRSKETPCRRSILGVLQRKEEWGKGMSLEWEEERHTGEDGERAEDADSFYDSVCFLSQIPMSPALEQSLASIHEEPDYGERSRGNCSVELFDDSIGEHSPIASSSPLIATSSPSTRVFSLPLSSHHPECSPKRTDKISANRKDKKQRDEKTNARICMKRPRRRSHASLLPRSPCPSSPLAVNSPSTCSPLAKQQKRTINIVDVCSSFAEWDSFVSVASTWTATAVALAVRPKAKSGETVCGVAVAEATDNEKNDNGHVYYVPLTDHDIYGSREEEILARSSTPLQGIRIDERKRVLASLLRSTAKVVLFDALREMTLLREAITELSDVSPCSSSPPPSLLCLSYLSFLSHMRTDHPHSLVQLADAQCFSTRWQPFLSSSSPRLKSAATAWICARLEERLRREAIRMSSEHSVTLEMDAVGAIYRIAAHGFRFDRSECDQRLREMRERMGEIEKEAEGIAGKRFNLESPSNVAEVLFTHLRLPFPGSTAATSSRHLSTNKVVLEQLRGTHPLPALILEYRRLKHALSQCIVPLRECMDDTVEGGSGSTVLIHTRFSLFTSTGRVQSTRPNIQNVGKDAVMEGFSLRSLFVPSPDCDLYSADFCQLELRVLAFMSGDRRLRELLNDENVDVFTRLSGEWNQSRATVKVVCYGIIYGMGARTLSEKLKCAKDEAAKLISDFFATFPRARTYIDATNEEGVKRGYVSTALGGRRVMSGRGEQKERSREERQAINFTIQGTASEIFKSAVLAVEKTLWDVGGRIVMQVHDEIIVEMPSDSSVDVPSVLKSVMESAFPVCTVKLPVKVTKGTSWDQLK